MDGNLVILAGGVSSRMRKPSAAKLDELLARDADKRPKTMIRVGQENRPFLDFLLYNAKRAGYTDVVIVTGEHDASFKEYYGASERGNRFHGLTIGYARQRIPQGGTKPLGTADALLQALKERPDWRGKRFTVCNGDNLYSRNALQQLLEVTSECAMIGYDREALQFAQGRIEQFAVVKSDPARRLLEILEKPTPAQFAAAKDGGGRISVSMNVFRFLYERIFSALERTPLHPVRLEKELATAIMLMLKESPGCLLVIPLAEHVLDLTNRDDIINVARHLDKEFPVNFWRDKESRV